MSRAVRDAGGWEPTPDGTDVRVDVPLKGLYSGGDASALDVTADMTRLA